ncbi:hypothetical protein O6H91_09G013400 [Diphasiastrum complanatum]|uniref:Uncharacterized protein n=1 Tax=Diphasiastrum complanatum TaxID=34168 RepID=A0ACC2CM83_DIPCM|nr:hypothetical protein O6H91_09G013400 [Diphasiastrum complanatum]
MPLTSPALQIHSSSCSGSSLEQSGLQWQPRSALLPSCRLHIQRDAVRLRRRCLLGVVPAGILGGLLNCTLSAANNVAKPDGWAGKATPFQDLGLGFLELVQSDGGDPPTTVYAPGRRIVAVGDLHGDLEQTRRALRLAGVLSIEDQDHWVGGSTVLVQVGDLLDRGDDEIAIMSLLRYLSQQAGTKGGAVFQVNGNHETMNVAEDFRFVSPGGFEEAEMFVEYCEEEHAGDWEAALMEWRVASRERKAKRIQSLSAWLPVWNFWKMQKGVTARTLLFSPGGPLAKELARNGVVLKVNDWLFAHGGVLPHHVEYGLERMNREVSQWMRGERNNQGKPAQMPFIATRGFDSIVWSRFYSRETFDRPDEQIKACAVLVAALDAAGANGLVVGHTPQIAGANCECRGRIWRIDVGMSSGVLKADPEVLEILGNQARVIRGKLNGLHIDDDMIVNQSNGAYV